MWRTSLTTTARSATQGFDRLGQLAVHFRDRLTALGSRPLERGQPLRLEAAQ